jgi:hypothetical protein
MKIFKYKTLYRLTLSFDEMRKLKAVFDSFEDGCYSTNQENGAYAPELKFLKKFENCKVVNKVKNETI